MAKKEKYWPHNPNEKGWVRGAKQGAAIGAGGGAIIGAIRNPKRRLLGAAVQGAGSAIDAGAIGALVGHVRGYNKKKLQEYDMYLIALGEDFIDGNFEFKWTKEDQMTRNRKIVGGLEYIGPGGNLTAGHVYPYMVRQQAKDVAAHSKSAYKKRGAKKILSSMAKGGRVGAGVMGGLGALAGAHHLGAAGGNRLAGALAGGIGGAIGGHALGSTWSAIRSGRKLRRQGRGVLG